MLEQVQTWWQNTNPEMQAAVQEGSWLLVALLGGLFLGGMVARALRAKKFDAALRGPTSSPSGTASKIFLANIPLLVACHRPTEAHTWAVS